MLCEASSGKHKTTSCRRAATVRVSLANQATVLVTGCRSQSTLRGSSVTGGHVARASALAGALGTAEVARNAADANGDLIGLAATRRVAIVGRVGRHGHCHLHGEWLRKLHDEPAFFPVCSSAGTFLFSPAAEPQKLLLRKHLAEVGGVFKQHNLS